MFRILLKKLQSASNFTETSAKLKFRSSGSKSIITLILFLITITVNATVYYVSNSGNDSNSGTTTSSPWKSLAKVNSFSFKPGDQILFNRGDQWVGTITAGTAGTSGNPIIYGAYGTGSKPMIYGSEKISGWTKHSGNIYKASFNSNINQLFLDEKEMKAARHPNSGYIFIKSTSGSTTLTSDDLNGSINYSGAKWFGRTNYFTASLIDVKSSGSNSLTLESAPRFPLKAGLGFFLMNKLEFLDQPGEWFYDDATNTVYLWTARGDSPENYTIRGSVHNDGFYLSGKDYVTIKDIHLLHQAEKGIHLRNSDYVVIDNNTFSYADGFGIYSLTDATNLTITNNSIEGVNHYGMYIRISNSLIADNKLSKIALFDNIGLTGTGEDNFGGGIYLAGETGNNKVRYNRLTEIGYSGILFGKPKNIIEYNFVKDVCLLKSDMGGIYTSWFNRTSPQGPEGSIIRNNIVLNVKGEKYGYTSTRHLGEGIYVDESAKDVTVENNTIAHVTNSGVKLHKNENSIVRNNTILDARQSIHVLHSSGSVKNKISSNILMAASDRDDYLQRQVLINESARNAICDNNEYVNPYASDGIFRSGSTYYDFSGWKSSTGQDGNSNISVSKLQSGEKESLFYNDTKQDKSINLGTKVYKDLKGNKVTGTFVLKPFTSRILIGTGTETVTQNQSPVISDQTFEINAEKAANDIIGKVSASDPDTDQTIQYSIIGGNSEALFGINSTSGELYTKTNIPVSANKTIVLVVEVKDNAENALSASADVTINIKAVEQDAVSDVIAPSISSFSIPSISESLSVSVNLNATDNTGVVAWKLAETSATPSSNDAGWQPAAPAEYTFSGAGTKTLYAWAKDASGNISASASGTVVITLPDDNTTTPGDSVEFITICEGQDYLGWTEDGIYQRTIDENNSVQAQGLNLISEGNFSNGTAGWNVWGAAGYSLSMINNTTDYISAPGSMQLNCTENGTSVSSLQFISTTNISVEAGKEYELSFYAKATTSVNLQKFVILKRTAPYTYYGSFESVVPTVTNEWTQYKLKFTASLTADDASFRIYLGKNLPEGNSVYFDDIKLSEKTEETVADSKVISTYLTVTPIVQSSEDVTIGSEENYLGWTEPGQYTRTIESSAGCDSIITTNLTVTGAPVQPGDSIEIITLCEGQDYMGWTESGTYQRAYTEEQVVQNTGDNIISNADFSNGTTNWSVWGASGYSLSMTANSQDYVSAPGSIRLSCTATGASLSPLQFISKTDIPVEAGKEYELSFYAKATTEFELRKFVLLMRTSPYTHYGSFEEVVPTVTKEWTHFKLKFTASETATDGSLRFYLGNSLPVGHSVYFDDISFSEQTQEPVSDNKVITTYLTVNPVVNSSEDVTIKSGENYLGWTESGQYTRTLESSSGCDSIITTNLIVTAASLKAEVQYETENVTICEGSDYNGWTESGVYETLISSETGQIMMTTYLTVEPSTYNTETIKINSGEQYNGWTEPGIYEMVYESASGCDSIVVTKLIVRGKSQLTEENTVNLDQPVIRKDILNDEFKIEGEGSNDFLLYPNPAQTFINVEYRAQPDSDTRIEIVDASGRIVHAQEAGMITNRIDFNQLNPGLYYLRSLNKQSQRVEKFIIK